MEIPVERSQRRQLCGHVISSDCEARRHLTKYHSDNPIVRKALRAISCERSLFVLLVSLACCIIAFAAIVYILSLLV